jgi:Dimerisation domain
MDNNQFEAVTELWKLLFSFHKSMSLKCVLDLGIVDAICKHGKPMTLSQLHSSLSLPPSKKPYLCRLMRLMNYFGFFQEHDASLGSKAVYDLTPLSRIVTNSNMEFLNLLPLARLNLQDVIQRSYFCIGDWFKQEEKLTPFCRILIADERKE